MPQATLDKMRALFPGVVFLQKYGTTEVSVYKALGRG